MYILWIWRDTKRVKMPPKTSKCPRFAIIILCPYVLSKKKKEKKKKDCSNLEKFANAVIDSVSIIDAKNDTTTTGVQYDRKVEAKNRRSFFKKKKKTMTRLISGSCRKNRGKGSSTHHKKWLESFTVALKICFSCLLRSIV